jgi:hypothetical protein
MKRFILFTLTLFSLIIFAASTLHAGYRLDLGVPKHGQDRRDHPTGLPNLLHNVQYQLKTSSPATSENLLIQTGESAYRIDQAAKLSSGKTNIIGGRINISEDPTPSITGRPGSKR